MVPLFLLIKIEMHFKNPSGKNLNCSTQQGEAKNSHLIINSMKLYLTVGIMGKTMAGRLFGGSTNKNLMS